MKDTVRHVVAGPALVGDAEFRLLVDSVSDYAIFLLDAGGFIRTWNAGAKRIKGYEPEEAIGRHVSMFYPEELIARNWPEHELDLARDCGHFETEDWRVRKDGTRFWASIVITRLLDERGQLRGYSKITRDVSERRQQDEQLRHSEERFRLLVEGVQDYAIFMLDPSGHVVSWNAAAQRTKGYEATEILGKHFSIFYPEELKAVGWPAEELRRALAQNRFEDEGWRIRKDGSRFWANVVITPLHDALGRHRGFAKVTRDLTDKRRISRLEDEGRRLTDFLAMLGHELRNPLAPISNAVSIIEMADVASEPVRVARAVISRQLKQMTRLVDDLMDVGRITSGKIHLEFKPVNLREAVGEAIEAAEPLVHGKGHSLKLEIGDCDPWLQGDKARIVQVVGNLLTNAVKFTPDGGLIVVALRCTDSHAEISVRDTGVGIPPELFVDIFNPFVQGDQDAARSQGGLGLGLSLVREIVLLHHGDVNVYSPAFMGRGSEFLVRLPRSESPADAATLGAPTESGARRKILVVDDNQDSADTMRTVLDAMGYRTGVEYDGHAALAAITSQRPDVVLLDIGLPGLNGIEVAERVRRGMANPPRLIAVTGYGQDSDRAAAFHAGFHAHLTKPVDVAELAQLLQRLLP